MKNKNTAIQAFLFMVPIVLLVICFTMISHSKVSANTVGLSEVTKVESVLVRKGDTLSGIAEEYAAKYSYVPSKEYLKQIKNLNDLSSEYITAGSYLLLPNYRA